MAAIEACARRGSAAMSSGARNGDVGGNRKFANSLLEGDGFELLVPREKPRYPIGARLILLWLQPRVNPRSRRGFLRQVHLSPRATRVEDREQPVRRVALRFEGYL